MKKVTTTEPISHEQIQDWKDKYKSIYAISVPETDEPEATMITGYYRKAKLSELGLLANTHKDNPILVAEAMLNTCFIGGHPAFEQDEEVREAAMKQIEALTKVRHSEIKKL